MTGSENDASNHHLWRNRRTWWVAFTIVLDGYRQQRIRQSLGTRDLETARRRRDALFRKFAAEPRVSLSIRLREGIRRHFGPGPSSLEGCGC